MCDCHDPAVFGHREPCSLAAPRPTRLLVDGTVITMTDATVTAMQGRQRL